MLLSCTMDCPCPCGSTLQRVLHALGLILSCGLQPSLPAPFLLPTGAKETEDISPDLTHKDGHQPKTSSASNILELSFLLLASSLLRALLL